MEKTKIGQIFSFTRLTKYSQGRVQKTSVNSNRIANYDNIKQQILDFVFLQN